MATDFSILTPVLVQVALTFFLLFWMALERYRAIRARTVIANEPGVRPTWTGRAGTISNAFHNQLEMPMLFYAVVAFILMSNGTDWEQTALAWLYVILRIIHAAIHTTYNKIAHRFVAYLLSNIVLIALWVNLALWHFLGW
jgi:hypothetical protein